jgi:hypothetical protein
LKSQGKEVSHPEAKAILAGKFEDDIWKMISMYQSDDFDVIQLLLQLRLTN